MSALAGCRMGMARRRFFIRPDPGRQDGAGQPLNGLPWIPDPETRAGLVGRRLSAPAMADSFIASHGDGETRRRHEREQPENRRHCQHHRAPPGRKKGSGGFPPENPPPPVILHLWRGLRGWVKFLRNELIAIMIFHLVECVHRKFQCE
jgi:hypothetical protein